MSVDKFNQCDDALKGTVYALLAVTVRAGSAAGSIPPKVINNAQRFAMLPAVKPFVPTEALMVIQQQEKRR